MNKIKNWRYLLEKMVNSWYEYNNNSFRVIGYNIKEPVRKVDITTSSRTYTFDFDTMELVFNHWKVQPGEPAYDHLSEVSSEDYIQPDTLVALASVVQADKSVEPISMKERFESLVLTLMANQEKSAMETKGKIDELIANVKGNQNYAPIAKNILNALKERNKADVNIIETIRLADKIYNKDNNSTSDNKKLKNGISNSNQKDPVDNQHP